MKFEWDARKERQNIAKHGVSFKEAEELFASDVDFLEIYDADHSATEERFIAIGPIRRGVVLVVFTERVEDTIRFIVGGTLSTPSTWSNTDEEHT
jgi:uncharacterized DUF497 family protein